MNSNPKKSNGKGASKVRSPAGPSLKGSGKAADFESIDAYIDSLPRDVQGMMSKLRGVVRKAAPDAVEIIRYRMPTFFLDGNLIHFAAYKKHIGMYPMPHGNAALRKAMEPYRAAKDALRFPMDKALPFSLIEQVIAHRVKETAAKRVKK
jgi:uncharacterized protein YdhG (YjbR/CyaY superfamily)